ncbi:hypothetical protein ACFQV2_14775 [Actinokineospora soli]|uniref:Uncharacterized protein n=1 Tax=Actinokineospora soli TaxID=1048753 RepID=A0ABW2TN04_9PSEU
MTAATASSQVSTGGARCAVAVRPSPGRSAVTAWSSALRTAWSSSMPRPPATSKSAVRTRARTNPVGRCSSAVATHARPSAASASARKSRTGCAVNGCLDTGCQVSDSGSSAADAASAARYHASAVVQPAPTTTRSRTVVRASHSSACSTTWLRASRGEIAWQVKTRVSRADAVLPGAATRHVLADTGSWLVAPSSRASSGPTTWSVHAVLATTIRSETSTSAAGSCEPGMSSRTGSPRSAARSTAVTGGLPACLPQRGWRRPACIRMTGASGSTDVTGCAPPASTPASAVNTCCTRCSAASASCVGPGRSPAASPVTGAATARCRHSQHHSSADAGALAMTKSPQRPSTPTDAPRARSACCAPAIASTSSSSEASSTCAASSAPARSSVIRSSQRNCGSCAFASATASATPSSGVSTSTRATPNSASAPSSARRAAPDPAHATSWVRTRVNRLTGRSACCSR